jgi:hypothetical protein
MAIREMNEFELGWVAGLLEAEGAFYPVEFRTPKYGPYRYGRVSVVLTDLDVLERLRALTGVGNIAGPVVRENPNHKPIWQWKVSKNKESITLMRAVYPWMGERRRARIDEVLALVEKGRG